MVIAEIDFLYHLKTGDCDESVKGDAHTAHYAGRDGRKEGHKGREERSDNSENCGRKNGVNGGITCDSNASDRLAVGGVRAAAEDRADDRAYAVAEQGAMETGLLKKLVSDDGGEVLVVCYVLGENNECDGNICNRDRCYVLAVYLAKALCRLEEGEVRVPLHVGKAREVDDDHSLVACRIADNGEHGSYEIACDNTDHERNELSHFLSVDRANGDDCEGHKCADEAEPAVEVHLEYSAVCLGDGDRVADSIACERETDDSDGRSDDNSGHELVNPTNACELNDNCYKHIYEPCECSADDYAREACLCGSCAREGCRHGAEECERGAEEYGASELGEEQINDGAHACAEERCGLGHSVADNRRNGDRCRKNCEQLLERKYQIRAEFRLVFDLVDKIHLIDPPVIIYVNTFVFIYSFSVELDAHSVVVRRYKHRDTLAQSGRDAFSYIVGAERQFSVSAVDEDCESDGTRPSDREYSVDCGSYGPTGVEHIIDEHDLFVNYVKSEL